MSTLIRLSVCLLGAAALPGFTIAASAQVGTYRPAPAMSFVKATQPDQCVAQCAGDAACRAWNFITVGPGEGVCEFLDTDVAPIASQVSVSGTAPGALPSSHRIVREPSHRTTRIGTPEPVRIQRRPVPRQVQPRPAAQSGLPQAVVPPPSRPQSLALPPRRPAMQTPRPRFRHSVDDAPRAVQPGRRVPNARPHASPRMPAQNMPAQASSAAHLARAQARQRAGVMQSAPRPAPATAPVPVAQAPAPRAPLPSAPPSEASGIAPQPATQPVTDGQITDSLVIPATRADALFGSLYDDVAMPAPADSEALADEQAPIATTQRVPVAPVTPVGPPASATPPSLKGLAGG